MELKDFVVTPCKSRLAFELIPKKKESLFLAPWSQAWKQQGALIEVETPGLVIGEWKKAGFSIFKSGKIIIRNVESAEKAKQVAQELLTIVQLR